MPDLCLLEKKKGEGWKRKQVNLEGQKEKVGVYGHESYTFNAFYF